MNTTPYSLSQVLAIDLDKAQKCLKRLCKHFKHKVDVQQGNNDALIQFEEGLCAIQAGEKLLVMGCQANNPIDLKAITDTMDRHLTGLLRSDTLRMKWRDADADYLVKKWG